MAQFATNADLAARLGVTFTPDEQSRADTLLQLASGLIQREARQTIAEVVDDVLTRPGTSDYVIRLPERPITTVSSVVFDGTPYVENTDYFIDRDLLFRSAGWGCPRQQVVITYTHGYAEIPDAIRAVCLEAAVRPFTNPGNVVHEQYGSERVIYSATTETPAGVLLNQTEIRVIHDVLRRQTSSLRLR